MTEDQLCREIRENLFKSKKWDKENRDKYKDNMKFLALDQWEGKEVQKRRGKRLMLTADMLNAPVDQVVNSVKQNRPGPKISPEGEGTDTQDAEIMEGILRRIDYENNAYEAFSMAMECMTGGNFGCWEVGLEWADDRSWDQKVTVESIPNPNDTVYFDPTAIKPDRSDAMWAMRVYTYDSAAYKAKFPGSKAPVEDPSMLRSFFSNIIDPTLAGWVEQDGVQVAKYWKVEIETEKLRMYTNGVAYWDSERDQIPSHDAQGNPVRVKTRDGKPIERDVEHRTVKWYISNGREILKKGDWPGKWIPLFPVYGKERWVDGKRLIFSLIEAAKNAQQAFNYAFTGACEVLATTTKAPFIGLLGQFRSKYNQWKTANQEIPAFLEYDPVDLGNGNMHVAPPQRNVQEPPIQSFLAFCNLCINAVQRATSIFDPSLGRQKGEQSGKAIEELQEQSVGGNFHWSDSLTTALVHYYRAVTDLVQQEYNKEQVVKILRADGKPDEVRINQTFEQTNANGQKIQRKYNIHKGNYAFAVEIGPGDATAREAQARKIGQVIRFLPPELTAQAADLIAKLNDLGPLGDQIAERWIPPQYRNPQDPASAVQHLAQAMQQNQVLQQQVAQLLQLVKGKQMDNETKIKVAEIAALKDIKVAEIKATVDDGERLADTLMQATQLQADSYEAHQTRLQDLMMHRLDHQSALEQNQQQHEQQMDQNQQQVDLEPEPEPANKE